MSIGQQARITTHTVVAVETVRDRFKDFMADNHLDEDERAELAYLIEGSYQVAMEADEGVRVGVALLRGGIESVNARRYGFRPSSVDLSFA